MTVQGTHSANEIILTRIYDASLQRVWDAWVNPEQVGQWWGPRGFTITTVRKDVRMGGDWLYTMHGPDGVDYPNHTRFLEVEPLKRLVYDHGGFEDRPPMFRVRVDFTEVGSKTRMDMTMAFPTAGAAAEARIFIKKAGGESTWDRLAEYLEKQKSGREIFAIHRSFEVDVATMYRAWTQPEHIMNWTPPTGMTGKYLTADIRPGGEAFYQMTGNGATMHGKARYLELVEPSRLVYTQAFVDPQGVITRHPFAPTWPETLKTSVDFSPEGDHQTRVSLVWEIFGEATQEERSTFMGARAGMTQGWTGSFDQLEAYLARRV